MIVVAVIVKPLSKGGTNTVTLDDAIVSKAMFRSLSNFHLES